MAAAASGQIGTKEAMMAQAEDNDPRPLQGWKVIAAYIGRSERTAKRWEHEYGLPVHRLDSQSNASVHAYRSELDDWLRGPARDKGRQPGQAALPPSRPRRWLPGTRATLAALSVALAMATAGVVANLVITAESQPPTQLRSEAAQARDFYLSGLYQLSLRTPHGLERAKQDFAQALRLDGKSDEAMAWLAKTYAVIGEASIPDRAADAFTLARYWAEKALESNSGNAEANVALGVVALYADRNPGLADRLFEKAQGAAPRSADASHWHAVVRMYEGDFDVALDSILKAQNLSPRSPSIRATKGRILGLLGRSEDARRELSDLIESAPNYAAPYAYLADLDFLEGRFNGFLENLEAVSRIHGDADLAAVVAGGRAVRAEVPEAFPARISEILAAGPSTGHEYLRAKIAALQGDYDSALGYLERAVATRQQAALAIKIDPVFREMRNSDRFAALVEKLGLRPIEPVLANTEALDSGAN